MLVAEMKQFPGPLYPFSTTQDNSSRSPAKDLMILFNSFSCNVLHFLNPFLRVLLLPWVDHPAAHLAPPHSLKKLRMWSCAPSGAVHTLPLAPPPQPSKVFLPPTTA